MADKWPDAEVGEYIGPAIVVSFEAETTITKGDPVYLSADMKVSRAGSAQNCIGIAVTSASAGEFVSVCTNGVVKVTAGDTIARGQAVYGGDASYRVLALSDQAVNEGGTATYTIYYARKLGIALQSAVAGDTFLISVEK